LKEKAERFNNDEAIQALLAQINADDGQMAAFRGAYSAEKAAALLNHHFDRPALGRRGQPYERLDQLVIDLLLGAR
jgi:xylose isomerase